MSQNEWTLGITSATLVAGADVAVTQGFVTGRLKIALPALRPTTNVVITGATGVFVDIFCNTVVFV